MMNNEDFDKAIRQKLEGLNQTYTESDIDKVNRHVRGKRRFPFKGGTGSWLMYYLSAAAFTVVTILSVSHFSEKRQPSVTNQNVTGQVKSSKSDKLTSNSSPPEPVSTEMTEIMSVYPPKTEEKTVPGTHSKTENLSNELQIASIHSVKANSTTLEPETQKVGNETKINPGHDKTKVQAPAGETSIFAANKEIISLDTNSNIPGKTMDISGYREVTKLPVPEAANDQKPEINAGLSAKPTDSLPAEKSALTGKTLDTLIQNISLKIRAGADFQLTNQSLGTGVLGEILFSKGLSFETGLRYRSYFTELYADRNDLIRRKHHDFKGRMKNPFEGKDHITDLYIQNRILEIPVTLNYYVPLRNNFSLSFALGTDLDIYLNQKLSFKHLADSGKVITDNFTTRGDVVPINNLTISAGIEKQWKSWVFQLQPYLKPKLKEVFYKPREPEFGIGAGVKYRFGK